MAVDRTANITIKAKDSASGALKGVGASLAVVAAAAAAAAAAIVAVVAIFKEATKLASIQEDADVKLAFALRSIGENSDESRESLFRFAGELQNLTGIGDEVIESMIGTLAQVGRLGGEELKQATVATLDLSRAMGIDLKAAAILMAKAAAGDTSALSRYGLKLDEAIPATEKFAALLKLVETNFGGSAEAAGRTFSGSLAKLSSAFGDVFEKLGDGIAKSETFRITMGAMVEGLVALGEIIKQNQPIITAMVDATLKASVEFLELAASIAQVTPRYLKMFGAIAKFAPGAFGLAGQAASAFALAADVAFEDFEASTQKLIDRLAKLREELAAASGKTTDVARDVGNLEGAMDGAGGAIEDAGEGLAELPDLGIESMDDLLDRAAAVQKAFVELTSDKNKIPPELYQATLDQLAIMALELNTLGIQVRDFANVSAEEAVRLLDTMTEAAEESREAFEGFSDQVSARLGLDTAEGQADALGSALVAAAEGGARAFAAFIRQLIAQLIAAIIKALILKAILAATGGGGAAFGIPIGGGAVGLQHGGLVTGGRRGTDSVAALLSPGEVVLPSSLRDDFAALSDIADAVRGSGGGGGIGATINNTIIAPPDRDREVLELIDDINEAVRRRGFTLVASEVLT